VNSNEVDQRIRAALTAAAATIEERDLSLAQSPATGRQHRTRRATRWVAPLLAAAAVIGVAIATAAIISTPSAHHLMPGGTAKSKPPTPSASQIPPPPKTREPTTSPKPTTTLTASKPPTGGAANCDFVDFGCPAASNHVFLQPLWPFADYAQARQWETVDGPAGHQPWHLDARQTALLFTQNYLGFSDITTVTTSKTDEHGAHIGVGYRLPSGQLHTAAVLHLVGYTPNLGNTTAGWEVVGSDDTDFSLKQPAYGSQVTSPMTVGCHITGVDETVVVDVKGISGSVLTGTAARIRAGGQDPWHASVSFHGSGVLTIVASTGGHLMRHERFAIQGVHT
jgi:hypothetical protein